MAVLQGSTGNSQYKRRWGTDGMGVGLSWKMPKDQIDYSLLKGAGVEVYCRLFDMMLDSMW